MFVLIDDSSGIIEQRTEKALPDFRAERRSPNKTGICIPNSPNSKLDA
jgi:hypothetical protein